MAKFEKQLFNQNIFFFGMTRLHAHAQYIFIVTAKYQKPSINKLISLYIHKQNSYLKANRK